MRRSDSHRGVMAWVFALAIEAVTAHAEPLAAEDSYFECAVSQLPERAVPVTESATGAVTRDFDVAHWFPWVFVQGAGDAALAQGAPDDARPQRRLMRADPESMWLFLRVPAGATLAGTVCTGVNRARSFAAGGEYLHPSTRARFLGAQAQYFDALARRDTPGAAWFRHRNLEAEADFAAASGLDAAGRPSGTPQDLIRVERSDRSDIDETFELLSGGRAVSENLRLDREIVAAGTDEPQVDVHTLPGIEVRAYDWAPLTAGQSPRLDPLAATIPADQHALFFPSFGRFVAVMDEADRLGTPILFSLEGRSEDAQVRSLYERQLCLSASALARALGDTIIASVALTGSDPYFRTGTDVALLFEPKQSAALRAYIAARHAEAKLANPGIASPQGDVAGIPYTGVVSPDRSISSYTAVVGGAVVVTNSLVQLERLARTVSAATPALATLPEFQWFRTRYPLGDPEESGFLVLSDATIRRWGSARWRIGASRRTRAAAHLLEARAAAASLMLHGSSGGGPGAARVAPAWIGQVSHGPGGVRSSTYGTPEFLTPIAELSLDTATKDEAAAYERFRVSYERDWRTFFDPIAIRIDVQPERVALDTTVRPLIGNSEYRDFTRWVGSESIVPGAGDPHSEAIAHFIASFRVDTDVARSVESFLRFGRPGGDDNPLQWLGKTIAVWVDHDAEWLAALQAAKDEDAMEDAVLANAARTPLALQLDSTNPLKLALFLTTLRAYMDQTAPGMCLWEAREYNGQAYVCVRPTEEMREAERELRDLAIWYAPTARALIVSLREDVLKRAIDRRAASNPAAESADGGAGVADATATAPTSAPSYPWLGESFALHLDRRILAPFEPILWTEMDRAMQRRAFAALPILNEWKRLAPTEDPVALHERIWHRRLLCPGGGAYAWNEAFQTMESTVYGHPGQPRLPGQAPPVFADLKRADFGLTFESDGLRARVSLERR